MSNYDWNDAATNKGKQRAPKIPAGQQPLEIKEVIFGGKSGPFKSNNGDPQILLVFTDGKGNEASQMYTLSDKAGFTLAKILAASGADMVKLTERGITPAKFADQRFATANLKGRKFTADVQWEPDAKNIERARIEPLRLEGAAVGKDDDDIPI